MRGNNFLEKMELIDPAYVEAADTVPKRKEITWIKWGAIAACLALVIHAGIKFLPQETPEEHLDLPILSVSDEVFGENLLGGYEGYMAYDISELVNANPWNENLELPTLPVYKNPLTYDETKGITTGASFDEMQEVLLEMADRLGVEAEWMTVVEERPYEEIQHKIGDESERVFEPINLITETDGIRISVGRTLHVTISFEPAISLPDEYKFTHYESSYEDMCAVAEYLKKEYENIIAMDAPETNISGGDYTFDAQQTYDIDFFDMSGTDVEKIVNYNFNRASFSCNDEGQLYRISISQPDLSKKVGDYPIITSKQARKLLSEGNYLTTVPYEIPGLAYVKKVELVYLGGGKTECYMPYYRFYVELLEAERENGLKTYGAYYVPAVEETYLSNMPKDVNP